MTKPLCLLLVDDNRDFRSAAAAFLSTLPAVQVVAEAASGRQAVEIAARLPVDLVLLDLAMEGMNGFAAARLLKALPGRPKIIIITLHNAPEYRHIAGVVGADGFVSKAEYAAELPPLLAGLFPQHFPSGPTDPAASP